MEVLEKMTINPAKLYNLEGGSLKLGGPADIVIFDENELYVVEEFQSRSSNSPFIGDTLYGKVKLTICDGNIVWDNRDRT